jgi:hypothetical protein
MKVVGPTEAPNEKENKQSPVNIINIPIPLKIFSIARPIVTVRVDIPKARLPF